MRDEKPELVTMVTCVYFEDDCIYQGFSLLLKSALAFKLASIFFIPTLTLGSETGQ